MRLTRGKSGWMSVDRYCRSEGVWWLKERKKVLKEG